MHGLQNWSMNNDQPHLKVIEAFVLLRYLKGHVWYRSLSPEQQSYPKTITIFFRTT